MPIPFSDYVDITSGVGAALSVANRNLGALFITGNPLCPAGTKLDFTSAVAVGTYFGTSSEEYLRAVFYFGWVSKDIQVPQQISFYFWNNDAATSATLFGGTPIATLAALNVFTGGSAGSLDLTIGGYNHTITGIDLGSAGSLTAVATALESAIQAISAGSTPWTSATVTYSSTTGNFTLTSGSSGADTIICVAAASNDLAASLGWLATNRVIAPGTAAQTLAANLAALIDISNNFGSFGFTTALALSITNIEVAANWNNSLTPNVQFIYSIPVSVANASTWSADLAAIGGCCLTLAPLSNEYPEMAPMMILAATNYEAVNSVQNYEFQIFALTPSVTTGADKTTYDALNVNYYGQTQQAGQLISFYQQGVMMGLPVNPSDQNVYANEIWFKDDIGAGLGTLLIASPQVPANAAGRASVLNVLQASINSALNNGTISEGKTFTTEEISYIAQITGSASAWLQVQNAGYWVDAVVVPYVVSSVTKYKIVYTLVYSKDDVIRFIQGSNILI